MYEQMINDDLVADIEADRLPQTPEIPTNISHTTVSFDRSAKRKRDRKILDQSSGSDTAAECSYTEHDSQTKKHRDNEDVSAYMQLRLDNIAEREAAMKAAKEQGQF